MSMELTGTRVVFFGFFLGEAMRRKREFWLESDQLRKVFGRGLLVIENGYRASKESSLAPGEVAYFPDRLSAVRTSFWMSLRGLWVMARLMVEDWRFTRNLIHKECLIATARRSGLRRIVD